MCVCVCGVALDEARLRWCNIVLISRNPPLCPALSGWLTPPAGTPAAANSDAASVPRYVCVCMCMCVCVCVCMCMCVCVCVALLRSYLILLSFRLFVFSAFSSSFWLIVLLYLFVLPFH